MAFTTLEETDGSPAQTPSAPRTPLRDQGHSAFRSIIQSLLEGSETPALLVDDALRVVGTNLAGRRLFGEDRGPFLAEFAGCGGCAQGPLCGSCLFVRAIRETVEMARSHRGLVVPLPPGAAPVDGERVVSLWTERVQLHGSPLVIAWCRRAEIARSERDEEREPARRERTSTEGRFHALFENIAEGVVTCRRERGGSDFLVVEANRSARRLEDLGDARAAGRRLVDLLPEFASPELRTLLEFVAENEGSETFGPRWIESSRRPGWRRYRVYALPSGEISIVYEDLTAQKRTELAFHEAQRLDAVGKMAGGVAHEFNNTLQTIMAAVEISRLRPEGSARDDLMNTIEGRVRQGRALVHELLLVGRKVVPQRRHVDLTRVVRSSCQVLRRVVREDVALAWSMGGEALPARCDPRQIDQILVNLVNNAVEAVGSGGRILVDARATEGWAEIAVSDDGPGIPAELRERIFEPFFTTKAGERSAGLGLAVVRGIVEQNRGFVEALAAPGGGACVRVRLPLEGELADSGEDHAMAGEARVVHGRGRRLLVVEDEEGPREMLREMLDLLGYQVDTATSGEEALARATAGGWDLVLTDFMLPGMNGRELARRLRDANPAVGVVMMSGYAQDEGILEDVEAGALRFIQKPFELSVLAQELEGAMDPFRRSGEAAAEGEDRRR